MYINTDMEEDNKTVLGQLDVANFVQEFFGKEEKEELTKVESISIPPSVKYETDVEFEEFDYEEESEVWNFLGYVLKTLFSCLLPKENENEQNSMSKLHQDHVVELNESVPSFSYTEEQSCLKREKRKGLKTTVNENYNKSNNEAKTLGLDREKIFVKEIYVETAQKENSQCEFQEKECIGEEEETGEAQPSFSSEKIKPDAKIVMADDERELNRKRIENHVDVLIEEEEWVPPYSFPEEKCIKEKKIRRKRGKGRTKQIKKLDKKIKRAKETCLDIVNQDHILIDDIEAFPENLRNSENDVKESFEISFDTTIRREDTADQDFDVLNNAFLELSEYDELFIHQGTGGKLEKKEVFDTNTLLQIDGNIEVFSSSSEEETESNIYIVDDEMKDIALLITFFRKFSFLWWFTANHKLCKPTKFQKCFFCFFRSSCVRLDEKREIGPTSIKVTELASALDQFKNVYGHDWIHYHINLPNFIEQTIKLLASFNPVVYDCFAVNGTCDVCHAYPTMIHKVNEQYLTVNDLIQKTIQDITNMRTSCKHSMNVDFSKRKCLFIKLEEPMRISNITSIYTANNQKVLLKSFVAEKIRDGVACQHAYFNSKGNFWEQIDGNMEKLREDDQTMNLICLLLVCSEKEKIDLNPFKYDEKEQKQISKYYQSELNTAKYKAQKKLIPQKIFCSIEGCTSTFSSTWTYKRHLVEIHSFVETKLAEKIEAEGLLAETFSGRITCPVLGCRAGFSLVQSFRDHLDNHGMVKQKIAEAVEKHQDQSKHIHEAVLKAKSEHTGLVRIEEGPTKNICFMNASLQFLRESSLEHYLRQLERIEGNEYRVCDSLLNLLSCKTSDATGLRELIAMEFGDEWKSSWNGHNWVAPQQCAAEFITFLFQLIMKETSKNISDFEHAFGAFKERVFIDVEKETEGPCSNCKTYPSQKNIESDFLYLNIDGCGEKIDLSVLLNQQFVNKKIDMKCSTCCPHESGCTVTGICAQKPAIERTTPMFNKYTFVMLKRFITPGSPKIVTCVKIPEIIILDGVEYEPVASLEHLGNSMDSGHFITFTKVNNQTWLKHDDEKSSVTKFSEVGKNAYIVMLKKTGIQVAAENVAAGIGKPSMVKDVEAPKRTTQKGRGLEPPGSGSQCPRCHKSFSRRTSVKRHLKDHHGLTKSDVDKFMKKVRTCLEYCNVCKQFTSNHARHKKKCRGLPKQPQVQNQNCQIKLARNGFELIKHYKIWLETENYNENTVRAYCNTLKNNVIPFWERNLKNFLADGLLYPLDSNTDLPSISSYISEAPNESNALAASKAYLGLLSFLQERFAAIYIGDLRREAVGFWNTQLTYYTSLARQIMKRKARTAKKATQVNKSQKIQSGTDLAYNQDRMRVIMTDIINSPKINGLLKKIDEDEDNSNKYEELYLRNLLGFLVFFYSGGKRGEAISNLTVGELNAAQREGSNWVARVNRHKVMRAYGSALLVMPPILYRCLKKYLHLFPVKGGTKDTDWVFRTKNDKATRMYNIMEYSKEWVMDCMTEEEFKSFKPAAIRKGWVNLAEGNPDPRVRELAVKLQDHSEPVRRSNYSQMQNKDMVATHNSLLSSLVVRDEESDPVVANVELERDEELDGSEKNTLAVGNAQTVEKRTRRRTRRNAIITESDKTYLENFLTSYPSHDFLEQHKEDSRFMEIWNKVFAAKSQGTCKDPFKAAQNAINEVRRPVRDRAKRAKKFKRSENTDESSTEEVFDDKLWNEESASEVEKDSEDSGHITPQKVLTPGTYKSDLIDMLNKDWTNSSSSSTGSSSSSESSDTSDTS